MYVIKVSWLGGPNWNPDAPSMIDNTKKKTAVEHLIETGGQTLDEAIEAFGYFKPMPIKVRQEKSEDPKINWNTILEIQCTDQKESEFIKDELVKFYTVRQEALSSNGSGYSLEINVEPLVYVNALQS